MQKGLHSRNKSSSCSSFMVSNTLPGSKPLHKYSSSFNFTGNFRIDKKSDNSPKQKMVNILINKYQQPRFSRTQSHFKSPSLYSTIQTSIKNEIQNSDFSSKMINFLSTQRTSTMNLKSSKSIRTPIKSTGGQQSTPLKMNISHFVTLPKNSIKKFKEQAFGSNINILKTKKRNSPHKNEANKHINQEAKYRKGSRSYNNIANFSKVKNDAKETNKMNVTMGYGFEQRKVNNKQNYNSGGKVEKKGYMQISNFSSILKGVDKNKVMRLSTLGFDLNKKEQQFSKSQKSESSNPLSENRKINPNQPKKKGFRLGNSKHSKTISSQRIIQNSGPVSFLDRLKAPKNKSQSPNKPLKLGLGLLSLQKALLPNKQHSPASKTPQKKLKINKSSLLSSLSKALIKKTALFIKDENRFSTSKGIIFKDTQQQQILYAQRLSSNLCKSLTILYKHYTHHKVKIRKVLASILQKGLPHDNCVSPFLLPKLQTILPYSSINSISLLECMSKLKLQGCHRAVTLSNFQRQKGLKEKSSMNVNYNMKHRKALDIAKVTKLGKLDSEKINQFEIFYRNLDKFLSKVKYIHIEDKKGEIESSINAIQDLNIKLNAQKKSQFVVMSRKESDLEALRKIGRVLKSDNRCVDLIGTYRQFKDKDTGLSGLEDHSTDVNGWLRQTLMGLERKVAPTKGIDNI